LRLGLVLGVVGFLLWRFAFVFLVPLGLALFDGVRAGAPWEHVVPFATAFVVALGAGYVLTWRAERLPHFRRSEALGVVAFTWLLVAVVGAVPYVFDGLGPLDAFFESMSGFTTTGATILVDWDHERAFYLWRAMTQWFGGLGVIALFVVVLPRLGIAGRQLFFAEASTAPSEAISPQVRDSARRLWRLYIALTLIQTGLLVVCGMSFYEGIVHSFTTMSAGGFSPHPQSIAGYANPAAEWVIVVFMVLSGTSFTLQYRAFTGRPSAFVKDGEFLAYVGVSLAAALGVAWLLAGGLPDLDRLREGAFQVTSLISSTGYASTDFNLWADPVKALLIVVMVVGGCAGSACGGPKVIRYLLATKFLRRELTQVLHPQAVIPIRFRRSIVPEEILRAVLTLIALYLTGYAATGVLVCLLEPHLDLATGFSAALACFGNIGPGFGVVGPMGSYADFSVASKAVLTVSMWVGRLEIVTVIALLHPHVWRNMAWGTRPR
jgi:trk system potassium uptake protein TrkH